MKNLPHPTGPFRWDLVTPDHLGGLLDGTPKPDLWFLPEVTRCAAMVLSRCADGELFFVGRSPDSLFDLLSGALSPTSWRERCQRLPLSLWIEPAELSPQQLRQFRVNLSDAGIDPKGLARRRHPAAFVDLVYEGQTYENLLFLLRQWASDEGVPWHAVRGKLRFIGITRRKHTSPNTWRWYQEPIWREALPRRAVVGVSLDPMVWSYLGDHQTKTTRSFPVTRWLDPDSSRPEHDGKARAALAEAVAIVAYGRSPQGRGALIAGMVNEPTNQEAWLRSLILELRRPSD